MKGECSMRLIILGFGGYGRTVADVAEQLGYSPIIFFDDSLRDFPLNSFISYIDSNTVFIPAFGNNEFRLSWLEKIEASGANLATLIHPTSYVSPRAKIGEGVVILPGAIVNTDVEINKGCIINIGAIVDHGTVLEEGVHLAPGAIVKGENRIKSCTKVESGEVIQARQYEK